MNEGRELEGKGYVRIETLRNWLILGVRSEAGKTSYAELDRESLIWLRDKINAALETWSEQ